jgi:hypothetical protein
MMTAVDATIRLGVLIPDALRREESEHASPRR